ncbi:MAG: hypothetical protein RIT45_2514 [Pseudomonadota bacterium]|jgi:3-methyladenine DNA glycosylase AlkC
MATLSAEFRFRDVYNPRVIGALGDRLKAAAPTFARDAFVEDACRDLDALGMNERVSQIADALERHLPADFAAAAAILRAAQEPPQSEPGKTDWDAFIVLPQCAFVSRRGRGDVPLALAMLREFTRRLSAEGDLRTFFEVDFERTWATLQRWCEDPDPHVRRLVSEGTRPRLPMAGRIERFVRDPSPVLGLLERLRDDPSEYVRRSVANNLNDISKDHPDAVLDVLERWSENAPAPRHSLVRHAARTLLKAGNSRALALFGLQPAALDVTLTVETPRPAIGGEVVYVATLRSTASEPQRLHLDYVVDFVKARGERRPKVFKWTERTIAPGESLTLRRSQHLRPTSGRTLYPGEHGLWLQVNGQRMGAATFEVV